MTADLLERLGLRAAAEGIPLSNADAALLADLAAAADLKKDREAAYKNWNAPPARRKGTRAEAKAAYMLAAATHEAVERRVIATPARTEAGAVGKLEYALGQFGSGAGGALYGVPVFAMRDALVVVFGCAPPAVKPRQKTTRKAAE